MLPVLAVDHLQGAPTRGIPELGNATLLRWNPALAAGALDLLMLEVLLAGYHRLRAREVPALPGRHVVSWTPDLPTLLALQRQAPDVVEVCHPGHALPKTARARSCWSCRGVKPARVDGAASRLLIGS